MAPARLIEPCPTCGRQLHISEQLLGQRAACSHCGASFQTQSDGKCGLYPTLLDRAAKLLAEAEKRLRSAKRFAGARWIRSAGNRLHIFRCGLQPQSRNGDVRRTPFSRTLRLLHYNLILKQIPQHGALARRVLSSI